MTTLSLVRNRLAVKAKKADAVLFYSQFPDGRPDYMSTHAACPVISVSGRSDYVME